jgi:radical S-adenosyl methionine domain-containing protein 2
MKSKNQKIIPSVNFHLWEPCNFRCKFCFATFQDVKKSILPKGHLPKEDAVKIIDKMAEAGFSKITFAGGEPTLCPWITDLIIQAKKKGLTTMIVTNGSGLTDKFFADVTSYLDWVVISIDSILPELNIKSGRHQGNKIVPDKKYYQEKVSLVNKWNVKLKINTVINSTNTNDTELTPFIISINPKRWKLFQTLRVEGQNDEQFNKIAISEDKFHEFIHLNQIKEIPFAVIEDNKAMTGTYLMVDPAGRFFDNTKGYHTYSEPILNVGIEKALSQITYNYDDFIGREGLYDWE